MHIESFPLQLNINKPLAQSKLLKARSWFLNAPWFAELARQRDPHRRGWAWDGYHLGYECFWNENKRKRQPSGQDMNLFRTCDWVGGLEAKTFFFGRPTRSHDWEITARSQSALRYVPHSTNRCEEISFVLYLFCV